VGTAAGPLGIRPRPGFPVRSPRKHRVGAHRAGAFSGVIGPAAKGNPCSPRTVQAGDDVLNASSDLPPRAGFRRQLKQTHQPTRPRAVAEQKRSRPPAPAASLLRVPVGNALQAWFREWRTARASSNQPRGGHAPDCAELEALETRREGTWPPVAGSDRLKSSTAARPAGRSRRRSSLQPCGPNRPGFGAARRHITAPSAEPAGRPVARAIRPAASAGAPGLELLRAAAYGQGARSAASRRATSPPGPQPARRATKAQITGAAAEIDQPAGPGGACSQMHALTLPEAMQNQG